MDAQLLLRKAPRWCEERPSSSASPRGQSHRRDSEEFGRQLFDRSCARSAISGPVGSNSPAGVEWHRQEHHDLALRIVVVGCGSRAYARARAIFGRESRPQTEPAAAFGPVGHGRAARSE